MAAAFLTILLQAAAPAPMPTTLHPSFDREQLVECAPETLPEAADCLLEAFDERTLDRMESGHMYRPALDIAVVEAWSINDPEAPLSKRLVKHDLYKPNAFGAIILSQVGAHRKGSMLNYPLMARALSGVPDGPTITLAGHSGSILRGVVPEGWTRLTPEECLSRSGSNPSPNVDSATMLCFEDDTGRRTMMSPIMEDSKMNSSSAVEAE